MARRYLIRIAELPNKIIGEPGEFKRVVSARGVAVPTQEDLFLTFPGQSKASSYGESTFNRLGDEDTNSKAVDELLATLPVGEVSAVAFNSLQFTASIKSSKTGMDNLSTPCVIKLYNVSKESKEQIKAEAFIALNVGDDTDSELPLAYVGQIVKVESSDHGTHDILKLTCNVGYSIKKNVRVSKSYPPEVTSYLDIVLDLIDEAVKFGMTLGAVYSTGQVVAEDKPKWVRETIYLKPFSGYVVNGNLMDELSELCNSVGYRAYLVHNAIYVEPKDYTPILPVISLGEDSIIQIQNLQDATKEPTGSANAKDRIKLTTFYSSSIVLNKKVEITDGSFIGYYDIEDIETVLNFEGKEWYKVLTLSQVLK